MSSTVDHSTPYAWPYDGRLDPRRLALIVVLPGPEDAGPGDAGPGDAGPGDAGPGDAGPGDAGTVVDGTAGAAPDPALGRIGELAGVMFSVGGVVVEVTTTSPLRRRNQPVAAPRRAGQVGVRGPAHRIVSGGVDGFFASTLDATLRALGRDQLVLCGQWLETGVHSTMRSANDRGYECLLALDACVAHQPDLVAAARSQVEMSGGIFGAVGDTVAVREALGRFASPDPDVPERTRT